MCGSPRPSGVLSCEKPDDIEEASSASHFSSKEPREENCHGTAYKSSKDPLQKIMCIKNKERERLDPEQHKTGKPNEGKLQQIP